MYTAGSFAGPEEMGRGKAEAEAGHTGTGLARFSDHCLGDLQPFGQIQAMAAPCELQKQKQQKVVKAIGHNKKW